MSIIKRLTEDMFVDSFLEVRSENFSREGLRELFSFLEEYSEGTGEDIEFDPISICCEFTEYDSIDEALKDYNLESMEELQNNTVTIPLGSGLIVQNF